MPEMTYDGPGTRFYTESRDAAGQLVGTVEPGDIRDLAQAPDQWWHESTDEDRAALAAAAAAAEQAAAEAEQALAEAGAGQPETAVDGGVQSVPQPVPGA